MKPALLVATKGREAGTRSAGRSASRSPARAHHPDDRTARAFTTARKRRSTTFTTCSSGSRSRRRSTGCRALRAIFSLGAGVDHVFALPRLPDVPIVQDRRSRSHHADDGICRVAGARPSSTRPGLPSAAARARLATSSSSRRPHDVTVGIMGLGVMGADAAEVLLRLGFQVRGWSRTPKIIPGVETFAGRDGLDAFLAGTDILVSLLPLTPETQGLHRSRSC